jgi:DNA-binding SARP family transcriptional activator
MCSQPGALLAQGTDLGAVAVLRNEPAIRRTDGVELKLLGGFELLVGGRNLELNAGGQRLLAFLALRRRPILRTLAAGTLWPDGSDLRASANLRSVLWRLHHFGIPLVESEHGRLRLPDSVDVDLRQATELAHGLVAGVRDPSTVGAWRMLAADVLPDWYEDWVGDEREHFHQLRLHGLEAATAELAAAGRFSEALEAALAAVAAEPLRESAHRAVIAVHLAEGNAAQAILQYGRCERLFAAELGIPPPIEMRDSIEEVMVERVSSASL